MSGVLDAAANVLENLPSMLAAQRKRRRLSLRQAADQIGVNYVTLRRIEVGRTVPRVTAAVLILRWLAGGS